MDILDFNKILQQLSSFCITYIGKELALALVPSTDCDKVKYKLNETFEAVNMLYKNLAPPFSEFEDITAIIKALNSRGSLSCKQLLDLTKIFSISKDLKEYFDKDYIIPSDFPILNNLFEDLYSNDSILSKIYKSILDENTIDDKASPELSKIRRKQKRLTRKY